MRRSWPIRLIPMFGLLLSVVALWSVRAPERLIYAQGPTVDVVTGWTGPLDFRLLADGTAVNLTGMTVELVLTRPDGTSTVDTSGDVTVTGATTGDVRYSPDATDLVTADSPLRMRWKVTDGTGKVVFFPNGRAASVVVHEV